MESLRSKLQESNLFEHASPWLRDRIRKHIAKEPDGRRWPWSSGQKLLLIRALGAVAAAAASLAIVFLIFQSHTQSTRTTAELIDAHVRSLQPGHLMEVQSTDQHTVKPWFDGKLDFIPPVSDFSQQGFLLVGGRLDILDVGALLDAAS
jgi:anti-sigma factor RsiW